MKVGAGSLALGELIGAAFFITSVVAGSMAIVKPFKVSRKSFLRDAIFFSGAVAFSVGLLAHGEIALLETSGMITYYIIYVIVVATWYWRKFAIKRRSEATTIQPYQLPDEQLSEAQNDEATIAHEGTELLGNVCDLETAGEEYPEMEQGYAGVQHQMRLLLPPIDGARIPLHRSHSNIRPSLLAALEVRPKHMRLMIVPLHVV